MNANANDIQEVLLDIGIPSSLLGFMYLTYAEELMMKNQHHYMRHITTYLYKDIADNYHTSSQAVERCIRHAINVGWNLGNCQYSHQLFKSSTQGTPSNSQFIMRLFYYLVNK